MKYFLVLLSLTVFGCSKVEEAIDKLREEESPTPTATPTPAPATPKPSATKAPTPRPTKKPTAVPTVIPVPTVLPTAVPTIVPTVIATPIPTPNPIASGTENFRDGSYGNLWKPVSDTTGNLVVVFHNKYRRKFSEGCFIERTDGKREELFCDDKSYYKCFGNPDRLTMRSKIKCHQAKEVKVTCYEAQQSVTFTVDPRYKGQVCTRHD